MLQSLVFCLAVLLVVPTAAQKSTSLTPKMGSGDRAVEACRVQALARLKYRQTVKWDDLAKEEQPGTWLISGFRTAKGPDGNAFQTYTCRIQIVNGTAQLKMISLFKESTRTGKNVFELFR